MNATDSAHLLVVDDDARLRGLLHRFLTAQGFRVTTAADAAEARALIKSIDFDCLILDVMMPGENGYRVAHQLREDEAAGRIQRRPRIILLTARDLRSEPEREQTFMEFSQADLMLYKPFDLEELTQRIRELLSA